MPAIHKAVATLIVRGDRLEPDEITRIFGTFPSRAWRNGEIMPSGLHRFQNGMWMLNAPPQHPSDINRQIADLLAVLPQELEKWQQLALQYELYLSCGWFMAEGNEGEEISPATLLALGERGIKLSLDLYAPT